MTISKRGTTARHGTVSRYAMGCRCVPCTDASADVARAKRAKGIPDDDARHDTTAGYVAGCRNQCCRDAIAAYERERQSRLP